MAMSIKSIPVLTGQDAAKFVAEADNNKNQATPALSEKAAERLKKVLEKSKRFYKRNDFRFLHTDEVEERAYYDIPSENTIATRLMYFDLKKA